MANQRTLKTANSLLSDAPAAGAPSIDPSSHQQHQTPVHLATHFSRNLAEFALFRSLRSIRPLGSPSLGCRPAIIALSCLGGRRPLTPFEMTSLKGFAGPLLLLSPLGMRVALLAAALVSLALKMRLQALLRISALAFCAVAFATWTFRAVVEKRLSCPARPPSATNSSSRRRMLTALASSHYPQIDSKQPAKFAVL